MTVVGFPGNLDPAFRKTPFCKEQLEEWHWEKDLGTPYGDINGVANPPEEEVNAINVRQPSYIGEAPKDATNPTHYQHKGVECIEITEHMNFNLGNVVKYCYRCDLKGGVEDLKKARWYLDREIARRSK